MHIHIGLMGFLTFVAYAIIFGFLWHTLAGLLSQTPVGQAMSYVF